MKDARWIALLATFVVIALATLGTGAENCDTPIVIERVEIGQNHVDTELENPTAFEANGYYRPTIVWNGLVLPLAIPVELQPGESIVIRVVAPSPITVVSVEVSACDGGGIIDAPDPIMVKEDPP